MSTSVIDVNWRAPVPCQVGDQLKDIDTPCLLVDMDKLEHNLSLMPRIMSQWPSVSVRPHAKAHKTPALGVLQVMILFCHTTDIYDAKHG